MRVAEVMTSPVVGIAPSASVADAATLMLSSHFSGLPVISADNRLVGVVTESDFLHRDELDTVRKRPHWLEFLVSPGREASEYVRAYGRRVEEVMSPDPVTISPDSTLEKLVELMTARKIKRVLVVENDELVGIVARADLVRAVLRTLPGSSAAANDDEAIRRAIAAELAKHPWANAIRVRVDRGVAELTGVIFEPHARDAARVAAENAPGVVRVVDRLDWIEPMSGLYIMPPATVLGA